MGLSARRTSRAGRAGVLVVLLAVGALIGGGASAHASVSLAVGQSLSDTSAGGHPDLTQQFDLSYSEFHGRPEEHHGQSPGGHGREPECGLEVFDGAVVYG